MWKSTAIRWRPVLGSGSITPFVMAELEIRPDDHAPRRSRDTLTSAAKIARTSSLSTDVGPLPQTSHCTRADPVCHSFSCSETTETTIRGQTGESGIRSVIRVPTSAVTADWPSNAWHMTPRTSGSTGTGMLAARHKRQFQLEMVHRADTAGPDVDTAYLVRVAAPHHPIGGNDARIAGEEAPQPIVDALLVRRLLEARRAPAVGLHIRPVGGCARPRPVGRLRAVRPRRDRCMKNLHRVE